MLSQIIINNTNIVSSDLNINLHDENDCIRLSCKLEEKVQNVIDNTYLFWNNKFDNSVISESSINPYVQSTSCYVGVVQRIYDPTIVDFYIETLQSGSVIDTSAVIDYDTRFSTSLKYANFHPQWQNTFSPDNRFSWKDSDLETVYLCVENKTPFPLEFRIRITISGNNAYSKTQTIDGSSIGYVPFVIQRDYYSSSTTAILNGTTNYNLLGNNKVLVTTKYSTAATALAITVNNISSAAIDFIATTKFTNGTDVYCKTPITTLASNSNGTLLIKDSDWAWTQSREYIPKQNNSEFSITIPILSSTTSNAFINMEANILFKETTVLSSSFDWILDSGVSNTKSIIGIAGVLSSLTISNIDPTEVHTLTINNTQNDVKIAAIEIVRKRKVVYDSVSIELSADSRLGISDDLTKCCNMSYDPRCELDIPSNKQLFTNQNYKWNAPTSIANDFDDANSFFEKYPIVEFLIYSYVATGTVYFDRYRSTTTSRIGFTANTHQYVYLNNDTKGQLLFSGTSTNPIQILRVRFPVLLLKNKDSTNRFLLYLLKKTGYYNADNKFSINSFFRQDFSGK